ncbi:protein tweety homolog 3-like [Oppia nitens]|uniref:protein tweety homolog 3-like n=1 Tax=Oppia nitens TaxID=1686743 RepID=UPI0023DCD980|nr:protein tweety homolog 3-like [Oppia nitens]
MSDPNGLDSDGYVRNYSIADIAFNFHRLTHVNQRLKPLDSPMFEPDNNDYLNSLIMFAVLPIIPVLIVIVVYIITTLVVCICFRKPSKNRQNISKSYKIFILISAVICAVSFIAGLVGVANMFTAIKGVKSSSGDVVHWFDEIRFNITDILTAFTEIDSSLGDIDNQLNDAIKQHILPKRDLQYYIEMCQSLKLMTGDAIDGILQANKTISKADINFVPDIVDKSGAIICAVILALLLLLAIVAVFYTYAYCSRCLLGCLLVLVILAILVTTALTGISLALSVGGSDFCIDFKPWIRSLINDKDVTDYFVDCVTSDQVTRDIKMARDQVAEAVKQEEKFEKIMDYFKKNCANNRCGQTPSKVQRDLQVLDTRLGQIAVRLMNLIELAQCRYINGFMNDVLDNICTNGVKGVVLIFCNSVVALIGYTALVFGSTLALR